MSMHVHKSGNRCLALAVNDTCPFTHIIGTTSCMGRNYFGNEITINEDIRLNALFHNIFQQYLPHIYTCLKFSKLYNFSNK